MQYDNDERKRFSNPLHFDFGVEVEVKLQLQNLDLGNMPRGGIVALTRAQYT